MPVLLGISLFGATIAGCTASISSPSASTSSPSSAQGTLNLSGTPPVTLDPALVGEVNSASYVVQIFSGLLQYDQNMNLVPDLAQSWDVSSDGTVYTFHLLHNAQFQNGKPVTASDFKYSWERALNPSTQSTGAGTYLNDIVGATDMLSGKATQLSGVQVIDKAESWLYLANDAPNCEFTHLNRLMKNFGMFFNHVTLHPVPGTEFEMGASTKFADHPVFKGVSKIYIKEVSNISLSGNAKPILTENGKVLIAENSYGKGYVFAIGDPWIYNEYIDHDRLPQALKTERLQKI